MEYQVKGKMKSVIVLMPEDKHLFDEIKDNTVKYLNMEIESDTFENIYGCDVDIKTDEQYCDLLDEWHGSIEITCTVSMILNVKSKEEAIHIGNMCYSSDFAVENIQLFLSNNVMVELEAAGSVIDWHDAEPYVKVNTVA